MQSTGLRRIGHHRETNTHRRAQRKRSLRGCVRICIAHPERLAHGKRYRASAVPMLAVSAPGGGTRNGTQHPGTGPEQIIFRAKQGMASTGGSRLSPSPGTAAVEAEERGPWNWAHPGSNPGPASHACETAGAPQPRSLRFCT